MHAVWTVPPGPTVQPSPVHPVQQITVGDLGTGLGWFDRALHGSYRPFAGIYHGPPNLIQDKCKECNSKNSGGDQRSHH